MEKIKAKLANEEYKRITRNVNAQVRFCPSLKIYSIIARQRTGKSLGFHLTSRKSTAVERWQKSDFKVGPRSQRRLFTVPETTTRLFYITVY